eukprot:scaffold103259_cov60-Phaeocystis_antarctica.AAC.1
MAPSRRHQRQRMLKAAPRRVQPRPIRLLGHAGRPYRPWFRHGQPRGVAAGPPLVSTDRPRPLARPGVHAVAFQSIFKKIPWVSVEPVGRGWAHSAESALQVIELAPSPGV